MTQDETILRGENADRLLRDKVLQEAIAGMKKEIIDQWSATPARDSEGRDWVWRHYKVVERFESILKGYVESGKMERFKVEQSTKDKAIRWFKRA